MYSMSEMKRAIEVIIIPYRPYDMRRGIYDMEESKSTFLLLRRGDIETPKCSYVIFIPCQKKN